MRERSSCGFFVGGVYIYVTASDKRMRFNDNNDNDSV